MKSLVLALALTLSSTAFARQYIQCGSRDAYSTEVAVVNLTTPEYGTAFMSSGMQNPEDERLLLNIEFDKIEGGNHLYKVVDPRGTGTVKVESKAINKSSDYLLVSIDFAGFGQDYSCFSRIYND